VYIDNTAGSNLSNGVYTWRICRISEARYFKRFTCLFDY
jgi:hypothetical protein